MADTPDPIDPADEGPSGGACLDCGRRYGDRYGFPDLWVPHDIWDAITPDTVAGAGLLCPSCICRRLHRAGLTSPSSWMSGPLAIYGDGKDAGLRVVPEVDDDTRRLITGGRIIVPPAEPGFDGRDACVADREQAVLSYPPGCTFRMGTLYRESGNINGGTYDRTTTSYKRQGHHRDDDAGSLARQDLSGWIDRPWACEIVTLPVDLLSRFVLGEVTDG